MVEDCPDGYCDGIKRLDDDQCYQDDTEFSLIEEIEERAAEIDHSPFVDRHLNSHA